MSRREFLKDITALSALFLSGMWPIDSIGKNGNIISVKKWELGACPLIYNNGNFHAQLIVSCPVGYNKTQNAKLAIHAFDPSGKLIWRKIIPLSPLKSTLIKLPQEWCSVLTLLEVEGGELSPNVEMSTYLSFDTPFGTDGHHCLRIGKDQAGSHLIPAPNKNEQIVVGFQNTSGMKVLGTIIFYKEDGSVEFSKELVWNPFQTHYASWGLDLIDVPSSIKINSKERGLLIRSKLDSRETIAPAAWVIGKDGSFTATHGWVEVLPVIIKPEPLKSIAQKEIAFPVNLYNQSSIWYPGDLVCFGKAPFSNDIYNSTIVIPNLTDEQIKVAIILIDEAGRTIGGTLDFEHLITIPAKGFAYISANKLTFLDLKKSEYSSVLCYTGQALAIASLVKIWTRSQKHFFVQHLRPQENKIKPYLKDIVANEGLGYSTDYWSFVNGNHSQCGLFIRNSGSLEEKDGKIFIFNESQKVEEVQIPPVKAGGFVTIFVKLQSSQIKSIRLLCRNGFLTLALLNIDPELKSIIHGQRRIRYLAMDSKIPQLPISSK